jgi:hypothetical protein
VNLLLSGLAPFLVQGAVLAVDEFHFHRRRGLGPWERWGHPLDTASVLAPLALAIVAPFDRQSLEWFAGLSVFSCLFVTKDEWIHRHQAGTVEHYLHALLFILHPLVFISAAVLWWSGGALERTLLLAQSAGLVVFLSYQFCWWVLLGRGRWPR